MEHFPKACAAFDAFHITKMPSQAFDKVQGPYLARHRSAREGLGLGRHSVHGEQQPRQSQLMTAYAALGRTVFLRELTQDALVRTDREQLERSLAGAGGSLLAPLPKTVKTTQATPRQRHHLHEGTSLQRRDGSINGLLHLAKRIERGFRSFHYFRLAAHLKAGRLNLHTQRPLSA